VLDVTPEGDCYYRTATITRDLYVAGVDPQSGKLTTQPKQITSRDLSYGAAWSPDGEQLAYLASRGQREPRKLVVVVRSGKNGEERELSPKDPLNVYSEKPQWFPDGRSLFVHSWDGKLHQFDVQTGELRPFLESVEITPYGDAAGNVGYNTYVTLSPDGRAVYYLEWDREAHQTRILRLGVQDGTAKELCRLDADNVGHLSVSPDGSHLAFLRSRKKPVEVWTIMTVATTGGEPKEVYRASPPYLKNTVWSKDGRRLFFMTGFLPSGIPASEIYSVPAEGGEPQPLGIKLHDLYFLSLHPDGKQLVFADEQWNNQLWVLKNLFPAAKASR
jgi:Tol biopolymer transport system component